MSDASTISVGHTLAGRVHSTHYRVVERLGAGGIGAVYRVLHQQSGESFALKVLHRAHAASDALRRRFEREAMALAALSHPNVVRITDHGTFDDEPYLVMELLEGESLAERLRRERLSAAEVRSFVGELLSALAYVHGEGLVHRDLKPANVFLQRLPEGGQCCKVLDFGFVKFIENADERGDPLTRSGEIFGTPAYMAPEQMGGDETSASTDVYALGVLLFEMVSGKRPFDGDVTDIMRGHLVEDPPPLEAVAPGLSPGRGLAQLVDRALAKRPADRFASALEMREAFDALPDPLFVLGEPAGASLGHAPTLVAAEAQSAPAPPTTPALPVVPARRPGAVTRAIASLRAFLRRLVRASAIALIVASLVVITISAATIYGLRDAGGTDATRGPRVLARKLGEGLEQTREVLADRLGGVLEAAPGNASAHQGSDSSADGTDGLGLQGVEGGNVAQARKAASEVGAEAGAELAADSAPAPVGSLPRARDPFRRAVPPELRKILRLADAGGRGGERTLSRLRAYNRQHPRDARGHLLLARLYWNRGWREDTLAQYELAMDSDPSARGAKRMLEHLQALAVHPKLGTRASGLIERLYGPQAPVTAVKEAAGE